MLCYQRLPLHHVRSRTLTRRWLACGSRACDAWREDGRALTGRLRTQGRRCAGGRTRQNAVLRPCLRVGCCWLATRLVVIILGNMVRSANIRHIPYISLARHFSEGIFCAPLSLSFHTAAARACVPGAARCITVGTAEELGRPVRRAESRCTALYRCGRAAATTPPGLLLARVFFLLRACAHCGDGSPAPPAAADACGCAGGSSNALGIHATMRRHRCAYLLAHASPLPSRLTALFHRGIWRFSSLSARTASALPSPQNSALSPLWRGPHAIGIFWNVAYARMDERPGHLLFWNSLPLSLGGPGISAVRLHISATSLTLSPVLLHHFSCGGRTPLGTARLLSPAGAGVLAPCARNIA